MFGFVCSVGWAGQRLGKELPAGIKVTNNAARRWQGSRVQEDLARECRADAAFGAPDDFQGDDFQILMQLIIFRAMTIS